MRVTHLSRQPYRIRPIEVRSYNMKEKREHTYDPSRIQSFCNYDPPMIHRSSSITPSSQRLWDSSANTVNRNKAKYDVKPKTCAWFMFLVPIVTGLVAVGITAGIFGAIALTSRQGSTNYIIELPTGTILLYSGKISALTDLNTRWLLCDGSAVSRTTYATLFSVIGITYGVGDGITTFNLPNFQNRFPFGSIPLNDTTLASGGSSTVTLTVAQLPAHTHDQGTLQTQTTGAHTHTLSDPGHNHGGSTGAVASEYFAGTGVSVSSAFGLGWSSHSHTINTDYTGITVQSAGDHSHTISGSTGSQGLGQSVNIMPPYQTVHYIIRV